MQTTQDLLQKKLIGKRLVLCQSCKKSVEKFDYQLRGIEELQEVGLVCPNCGEWYHSYFANEELKNGMPKGSNRQQRRAYQAKFNKFQKKQRKRFKMRKVNGQWIENGTVKSQSDNSKEDEDQASAKGIIEATKSRKQSTKEIVR